MKPARGVGGPLSGASTELSLYSKVALPASLLPRQEWPLEYLSSRAAKPAPCTQTFLSLDAHFPNAATNNPI